MSNFARTLPEDDLEKPETWLVTVLHELAQI
jgi:hypothetical protein